MGLTINLQSRKIVIILGCFALGFLLSSTVSHILKYGFGQVPGLFRWFNIDGEKNFPAAFSAALLLFCAALLLLIAGFKHAIHSREAHHWAGLGMIFLLLASDEWLSFHEKLGSAIQDWLPRNSVFHFAWIAAGAVFVIAVGLAYWKFLLRLPKRYCRLFLMAAGIFITGAIGMEIAAGFYAVNHQQWSRTVWLLLTTVEEGLEMAGVLTFIYALLTYIQEFIGELRIRIASSASLAQPIELGATTRLE